MQYIAVVSLNGYDIGYFGPFNTREHADKFVASCAYPSSVRVEELMLPNCIEMLFGAR
jgi:hypothetical protein